MLALLLHYGDLLLAHRGAQDIGLLERVARERLRRTHHLLLVDDHAIGVAQDGFEQRMIVLDRFLTVLAMDKRFDHPGIERARAEERNRGDNVLEA